MTTVDKIMALAEACEQAYYFARSGRNFSGESNDVTAAREALRAAIVEALDMGEPVAEVVKCMEYDLSGNQTRLHDIDWHEGDVDKLTIGTPLFAAKARP